MRAIGISVLSLALTTVVIANAYCQKKQFYPSVVYITKSNPSLAVIYIQAFICVLLAGKLMRKIFFGELRASEFEHLMERFWYAITETCLAFTVFRDDFNPKFVALFTLLLFLKSFHWLAEDRVDYMERSPIISVLFHIRVLALLALLSALDLYHIAFAYDWTVSRGASVQLVFGFEYAVLVTMVANVAVKYALYSVDLNSETPWENKAVFLLYTELVMGLIKVLLYLAFVGIMIRIYTLPLFALRPMYYTMRNFKKALNDVILSRRAIHYMNTLYPDATAAELQAGDNVCIICREEMATGAKKLPCNHIFHATCLRSWFQRQQTCPTCRLNILRPTVAPTAAAAPQPANAQQRVDRPRVIPNNLQNPFMNFNGQNPFQMLNPNLRNLGLGQPAGLAPGAPVAGEGQDGHGDAAGVAGVAGGATAGPNNNGNLPTNMPPFPPFPLLTPILGVPPLPTANLSNLTAEQLREMEGAERQNIEARIVWLRSIQVMLDTAVIMLQQYNTAAAYSRVTGTNAPSPAAAATPSTSGDATGSSSSATANPGPSSPDSSNTTAPSTSNTATDSDDTKTNVTETVTPVTVEGASSATPTTASTAEEDEIRRRRLQRFEQPTVGQ